MDHILYFQTLVSNVDSPLRRNSSTKKLPISQSIYGDIGNLRSIIFLTVTNNLFYIFTDLDKHPHGSCTHVEKTEFIEKYSSTISIDDMDRNIFPTYPIIVLDKNTIE